MEKSMHDLEATKQKLDQKTEEHDPAKNNDVVESVTTKSTNTKQCSFSTQQHEEEKQLIVLKAEKVETQCLRGHDEDMKAKLDLLRKELEAKREELIHIKSPDQTLILKERAIIEELQAARGEAVNCLLTMDGNTTKIGIKRMGEIDPQPFQDACSKKFCGGNWEEKFDALYSSWKENLNDASWNPFKKEIISGKLSVVVDENDKRMEELRKEWGKEAYRAVVDTLVDLNEYNSGLRYSIPEIWNFDEGRRAHLKEVIQYLFQQWVTHRKKDTKKSAAIVDLMAEKERLIKRLTDFNALMGEKDKLLAEKNAAIGKLMAHDAEKVKLIDKLSAKNNALLDAEKRKTQRLKQQIQKLAWDLHSQKEELGKQTKELTERKRNNYGDKETVGMNMESMDWCFGSLLDQGEILPKNLEDCTAPKSKEQNSSTSEDKKLEDQTMGQSNKCLEVEPDMLGKQLDGRSDILGVLEPTNHPHHLPMVAMFSTPSQSMTWEAIYQMACVGYEGPKTDVKSYLQQKGHT